MVHGEPQGASLAWAEGSPGVRGSGQGGQEGALSMAASLNSHLEHVQ